MKINKVEILLIIIIIIFLATRVFVLSNFRHVPRTHVVILNGGLGNQMFQYAFGKALEIKQKEKVLFYYIKDNVRVYNLSIFNLNIPLLKKGPIVNKILIDVKNNAFKYDKNLFNVKKPAIFWGYFQNENYFKDIKNVIIKDFTFPKISKEDKFNQYWIKQIKKAKNPVFIHIRQGDYISLKWDLKNNYYQKSVKYMNEHIKNPTYFVFCIDCDNFLKNEFNIDAPYVYIGDDNNKNNEDWKDMYLMTLFKHAIISNSTFSWWGAYLGPEQKRGIVVAPSPFILNSDEIICDNWVKIKR